MRKLGLARTSRIITRQCTTFVQRPFIALALFAPQPVQMTIMNRIQQPKTCAANPNRTPSKIRPGPGRLHAIIRTVRTTNNVARLTSVHGVRIQQPRLGNPSHIVPVGFFTLLSSNGRNRGLLLHSNSAIFVPATMTLGPRSTRTLTSTGFSPKIIRMSIINRIQTPNQIAVQPGSALGRTVLTTNKFSSPHTRAKRITFVQLGPSNAIAGHAVSIGLTTNVRRRGGPTLQRGSVIVISHSKLAQDSSFLRLLDKTTTTVVGPVLNVAAVVSGLDNGGWTRMAPRLPRPPLWCLREEN